MKIDATTSDIQLSELDSMDWLAATLSKDIIEIGTKLKNRCRTRELRKLKVLSKLLNYPDGRFYDAIDILLENNGVVVTSMIQNEISAINRQTVQKYLDELVQSRALNRICMTDLPYDFSEIDAICLRAYVYYINEDILKMEIYNIIDYFKGKRKQNFGVKHHKPIRIEELKDDTKAEEVPLLNFMYRCTECGDTRRGKTGQEDLEQEYLCYTCKIKTKHERTGKNAD